MHGICAFIPQQSICKIRQRISNELRSACLYTDIADESQQYEDEYDPFHPGEDTKSNPCSSSDSDCEVKLAIPGVSSSEFSSTESETEYGNIGKTGCDLVPELRNVLPITDKYTYIVESFKTLPDQSFCGASKVNFEAHIRMNLETEEQAKEWVRELSDQCKCTYRVTRTYKPALKRVTYKVDLHCQHFRKKLTKKQLSLKPKKAETLLSGVHCKKTQCPSTLKITIQKPPKP